MIVDPLEKLRKKTAMEFHFFQTVFQPIFYKLFEFSRKILWKIFPPMKPLQVYGFERPENLESLFSSLDVLGANFRFEVHYEVGFS
jgi:hypothetical protein